jgi:hypothetical protein
MGRYLMSTKSNEDLIEIVFFSKDNFLPEAILEAKLELSIRNMDNQLVADIKSKFSEIKTKNSSLSKLKLSPILRVICFFLPSPFSIFFNIYYNSKNQKNKANEVLKYTGYGLIFYLMMIFIANF